MEKYENDKGQIGVLVSGGFGAGWSSWNSDKDFMAMDKTLVKMRLDEATEAEVVKYCKKIVGTAPYMGGWANVEVEWVDKGTVFKIDEYDGSEGLEFMDSMNMRA